MRDTRPVRDSVAIVVVLPSVENVPELVVVEEKVEQLLAVTCDDIDIVAVCVDVVTAD